MLAGKWQPCWLVHVLAGAPRAGGNACWFLLFFLLLWVALVVDGLSSGSISRSAFLSNLVVASTTTTTTTGRIQEAQADSSSSSMPLLELFMTFLPISGCWATRVCLSLDDKSSFCYLAVLDTGSPFLTAPRKVALHALGGGGSIPMQDTSVEQYGSVSGTMEWSNMLSRVTVGNVLKETHMLVGFASNEVMQATGGVFVGLIYRDDVRPAFLTQSGYASSCAFVLDFVQSKFILSQQALLTKSMPAESSLEDPSSLVMPLVSLQDYGPNLYHYAVACESIALMDTTAAGNTTTTISAHALPRPLICVLDTGLTGCIVDQPLADYLRQVKNVSLDDDKASTIRGLHVTLSNGQDDSLTVTSNPKYFYIDSFALPWWWEQDQKQAPFVIALGCTFWSNQCKSLTIDNISGLARIQV